MKILIVTRFLDNFAGTELYTLEISRELKKEGHKVSVFSPVLGSVAEKIKALGIPVTDNILDYQKEKFDIIHAQHNTTAILARLAFPNTPMIFVSHGVLPDIEQPPAVDIGISKFIAVSKEVKENLMKTHCIPDRQIIVIKNGVDLKKFSVQKKPDKTLRNILVISNRYIDRTRKIIEGAAVEIGAKVTHIGLPENPVMNTLPFIAKADLVISLGRGALEAMACGRSVIIYDVNGGDGFVDESNFFEIRKNNFSGRRFSRDFTKSDLKDEFLKYSAAGGEKLKKIIQTEHSLDRTIVELQKIYKEVARDVIPKGREKDILGRISEARFKQALAFDQYGRHALIREIISKNRQGSEKVKILDVGGRGDTLRDFMLEDDVYYLDPYVDAKDSNYIEGDGRCIPLKDNSFDWVVSADVLEHIPSEDRHKFLSENLRVAKMGVVLAAPFFSQEVYRAEVNANENYKALTGEEHPWLKEHIKNGLPRETEIENFLAKGKYKYQKINNNSLFLWEYLTNISFLAAHYYTPEIKEKLESLNTFYNMKIFPFDHGEQSYRKIYSISKNGRQKEIKLQEPKKHNIYFHELLKRGSFITDKIMGDMKQNISDLQASIRQLNRVVEERGRKISQIVSEKEAEVDRMSQEILAMQNSKFWKLRNAYIRFGPRRVRNVWRRGFTALRRDGLALFLRKVWYFIYFKKKIPQEYPQYQNWIKKTERYDTTEIKQEIESFKYKPKISIIIPVYNVDPKWLNKCIESVRSQYYENWEICIHDDASTKQETVECLRKWQESGDERIKISFGKKNQHISGASNDALRLATGEFIALLDNDDELAPFALYENVKLLNQHKDADFIYSDEDKIDSRGKRWEPFFKPDWSPELLLSQMYTCHLGLYRKSIIDIIKGFRKGYEGAQDYDLVLRFIEHTDNKKIYHIPKVLYHWRAIETSTASLASNKDYAAKAAQKALRDYLRRNNISGEVMDGPVPGFHRVRFDVLGNPKVSIIIPFRDKVEVLKKCVDSILAKTDYDNYEIILVDNQSKQKSTENYLNKIKANPKVKMLVYDKPFSFSAINNYAVEKSSGQYVLLLNNDVEVITSEWLRAMLEQAQKEGVGAVGAKLLFPNERIQHAGIILGTGIAGHAFKWLFDGEPHYFKHAEIIKNYSGVTGACLMAPKDVYKEVGGLNEEELKVAYNDVDFCLKLLKAGYRVVYTPYAKLYHFESYSRGLDEDFKKTDPKKYERVLAERQYMADNWGDIIANDPYYSPNLTRQHENFGINTDI